MHPPDPHSAERALRKLCAGPASAFGERLLERACGHLITFRQFVDVAREMVRDEPDVTATYLAAMVALDMRADPPPGDPGPCAN